jgi:hypothetical protein
MLATAQFEDRVTAMSGFCLTQSACLHSAFVEFTYFIFQICHHLILALFSSTTVTNDVRRSGWDYTRLAKGRGTFVTNVEERLGRNTVLSAAAESR